MVSKDLVAIPLPVTEPISNIQLKPELRWIEGEGNHPLACRVYPATGQNPVLVYMHGIQGHSQWFENTASVLNSHGIGVYAADRRGSGMNDGERGHASSYIALLADIEKTLRTVAKENGGRPIFLFGNCWGGKPASVIARSDYKTTDGQPLPRLSALILTCPAIHTKVDFGWRTKFDIGLSAARGGKHATKSLRIPLEPHMFTDDPTYLEYIENDPLRLRNATTQFYFEQFIITLKAKGAPKHLTLPTLLIESGRDDIVDIAGLDRWFDNIKSADKTKQMFPNAVHSIDFDPACFEQYTQTLLKWITAHTPGAVA